ncbi:MAG: AraC family transcriptional regulator [Lachnospiraceae bacterium]|nr:AraC family transcriptional regulator [Lachnospiraceae bacterium]
MSIPYLYTIVEQDKISDMLKSFHACLELPIQVIDDKGTILQSTGNVSSFCHLFKRFLPANEICSEIHAKAGKRAMDLGETYIFSCHANLNHIVFPLINKSSLFGSVLVGPFLMDKPDSLLISDLGCRYPIPTDSLLELYEEAHSLPIVPPAKVTQISHLLYYMFSSLISDSYQHFIINQEKLHQQSRINEAIQRYKNYHPSQSPEYPYETEKELVTRVKARDITQAKALLNDLLGYVFFSEGSNLDTIKNRAIELCSLLSRAAIDGGASNHIILKINNQFLENINTIGNLDDLCFLLQETLNSFMENMFDHLPEKNHDLAKKAVLYIARNFSTPITLEDAAAHIHLSPAYFSTFFKQATGSSFKEYLNKIRIKESKRLLANSDYSIIDIAVAVGFSDQSYFSRVFKKYTGLTPKQYR